MRCGAARGPRRRGLRCCSAGWWCCRRRCRWCCWWARGCSTQSLNKLENTDLKLDAKNRYIVHINPQAAGYSQTQLEALYRTMEERFHAIPGVVKVGISTYTPMEDNNWGNEHAGAGTARSACCRLVREGECGVLRLGGDAVVMGRGITEYRIRRRLRRWRW